jgi:hypothetical protein
VTAVLGVDVSLGRGLDLALVEDGVVKEAWSRIGHEALRALLEELRPAAVAIDAPPQRGLGLLRDAGEAGRLPVPPRPGTHVGRRVAEYELSRRGIGSHQTHYEEGKLFSWMTAGFDAFHAAREAGYGAYFGRGRRERAAFEVFPYASYVALAGCLSPGRRWRLAWRRAVLAEAGMVGLPEDPSIDLVDAACAAFTGERFLRGEGSFVGDPREGVVVLPTPALEERYKRCVPPDDPGGLRPAASPVAPRLCECGCGRPVRRRFLPGHDARLRSRLVREARAGSAARRELHRLGWSHLLREE